MGDAEDALPPTKKRVAGRQLTKDDPDPDEDDSVTEMGTFKKASEEVMATRRIVKVRRNQHAPANNSNPFAAIRLVASVDSSAQAMDPVDSHVTDSSTTKLEQSDPNMSSAVTDVDKETENRDSSHKLENTGENNKLDDYSKPSSNDGDDEKIDSVDEKIDSVDEKTQPEETSKEAQNGEEKTASEDVEEKTESQRDENDKEAKNTQAEAGEENENAVEGIEKEVEKNDAKDSAGAAVPLSSFQQLSSSQNAFSGLAGTGFSTTSFTFGSFSKEGSSFGASSASFFGSKGENSSLFSFGNRDANGKSSSLPLGTADASKTVKLSMPEAPLETGEENEKAIFTADAIMYEYLDGGWKERGKGELKLNVAVSNMEKARLVMRAKGNFRLILNASLFPDMSLTNMDKRGITFACINSAGEGKDNLTTVALKFKDCIIVQEFRELVTAHKGKKASASEAPGESEV